MTKNILKKNIYFLFELPVFLLHNNPSFDGRWLLEAAGKCRPDPDQ